MGKSSKASMKNDMMDFNVIKFFGMNTHTGKVLCPLLVRWEFPSPSWVKMNTDEAARGYPGLATCGSIFRETTMRVFIGVFSAFLNVHTTLVAEFYGVIYALEGSQKLGLTNVCLECDSTLVCVAFTARKNVHWMFCN